MADKKEKKGKKTRTGKKHSHIQMKDYYTVEGQEVKRSRQNCPRCGPGTFLAQHKNRATCGRCGYTEFEKK